VVERWLADGVVAIHFAFIAFVMLGGLLALRWPRLAWVHAPIVIWGVVIEFVGFVCPLTPYENWLRHRGGEQGYAGGFIQHYLLPVIYPSGLTREIQIALGIFVLALNGMIYWRLWRRARPSSPAA
jgi:hypothetical protein